MEDGDGRPGLKLATEETCPAEIQMDAKGLSPATAPANDVYVGL